MVAPCFHPCSDPSGVSSFSVGKFSDLSGLFSTPSNLILRTSTHAQIPELLVNSVQLFSTFENQALFSLMTNSEFKNLAFKTLNMKLLV